MDNDGGITDSDISSYTSSDTKSDASSNDIVSSRGPYAYLLQWYDDGFDESVPEFKFNKRTVCKSKASNKRHYSSKQVPTLQPRFVLPLSTVGSVADNERKGKRNVRSDKSKEGKVVTIYDIKCDIARKRNYYCNIVPQYVREK
ncbi:hypothetical protein Tco_0204461 [Tanacetum coccineum]